MKKSRVRVSVLEVEVENLRMSIRDDRAWIEIGAVAVRTDSILVAARVATRVTRTRQRGVIDGVEYMCLSRFRSGER